jgi:hypothetical protein
VPSKFSVAISAELTCLTIDIVFLGRSESKYSFLSSPIHIDRLNRYLIYMGGIPMWNEACWNALENWKGFEVR